MDRLGKVHGVEIPRRDHCDKSEGIQRYWGCRGYCLFVRGAGRLVGLVQSFREDSNADMYQRHIRHVVNTPAFWGEAAGNSTLGSKEE